MAADAVISRELKSLHQEVSALQRERPMLNLLRQSALIERAALSGRRRHKAAHANAIGNNEGAGDSGARTQLPYRPLSPIWSGTVMTDEAAAAPSCLGHCKIVREPTAQIELSPLFPQRLESSTR